MADRPPEQVGRGVGVELVEDSGQLQADQREEDRVERERDDLPRRLAHQPHLGRRQLGCVPAHVDPHRHCRDHGRDADQLSRDVGEIAREQGNRHLCGREVEPPSHLAHDPADGEADRHAAEDVEHERHSRLPERERAADRCDDRDAVRDERGPVVDEALALDDRDDPPRHAEAMHDRRRRDRVGR